MVNLMHPSRVPGGKVIVQGVSLGGFEEARSCVRDGTLDPTEVRFFAKSCGWGPGQLAREVRDPSLVTWHS